MMGDIKQTSDHFFSSAFVQHERISKLPGHDLNFQAMRESSKTKSQNSLIFN